VFEHNTRRLYLLEPVKVVIQKWDEWRRLLARALRDVEEVWFILVSQELLRRERILFEETGNGSESGLMEIFK
jgi:hypothetical protein